MHKHTSTSVICLALCLFLGAGGQTEVTAQSPISDCVGICTPSFDTETEVIITEQADYVVGLCLADADNDGDLDVLSASREDNKIAWHENKLGESAQFNFGASHVISTNAEGAMDVFAADLDGDTDLDVLSASQRDNKIACYENLGLGMFGPEITISDEAQNAASVFAADLDGDTDLDILSASGGDNTIAWYENLGSLSFSNKVIISTNAAGACNVRAADLDHDGHMDVVSASMTDRKIAWYRNDGTGGFTEMPPVSTDARGVRTVRIAHMNNDSHPDIVSAMALKDRVVWFAGDGAGSFGPEQPVNVDSRHAFYADTLDMDNDGDTDVVSASLFGNKIVWAENLDGNGTFAADAAVDVPTSIDSIRVALLAGDLDNDGDMDFVSAAPGVDTITAHINDCLRDENNPDCNRNGVPDVCDIGRGTSMDCNGNGIPDECELISGTAHDCNMNGELDECEGLGPFTDCNNNGIPDECDILYGNSQDANGNDIPDECELDIDVEDCNTNGIPDMVEGESFYILVPAELNFGGCSAEVQVTPSAYNLCGEAIDVPIFNSLSTQPGQLAVNLPPGVTDITFTATNSFDLVATASTRVNVTPPPPRITLIPDPNGDE